MAAAVTGRYSSSNFNLQNIPHSPVVRRSFVTSSKTKLVMADYSSIEVRVLAELAKDEILLHEAIYGNVHAKSAAAIFKLDYDYFLAVLKVRIRNTITFDRSLKTCVLVQRLSHSNSLYGAGASALAVPLRCTDEEAVAAIEAWASATRKLTTNGRYGMSR